MFRLFRHRAPLQVSGRIRHLHQLELLAGSRLFDPNWYLKQYSGAATVIPNAYEHYLLQGAPEGRNPGPDFDGHWYLQQYPDVAAAGQNPLIHYIEHGKAEGREIRAVVSPQQARPLPKELEHSIEVLAKSHLFDPEWYLREYPDVAAAGENPAVHYLVFGAAEGRSPGPDFDGSWYLKCNTDVAAAHLNPLLHYLEAGASEGREIRRVIRPNALEKKIEARFREIEPLRTFLIPPAARRLTVALNNDDLNHGGSGTRVAIIIAALLAQHIGASLRFALRVLPDISIFTDIWKANGISWSSEIEFVNVGCEAGCNLAVSESDFFLTTSWQTTRSVRSSVDSSRIIYLVQDDERMAYPPGDDRLRCEETLADPELLFLVASEALFEYLTTGPSAIDTIRRRGAWFERAVPLRPCLSTRTFNLNGTKANFLFDARQSTVGSLYWRGLEVIGEALEEGLLKRTEWNFYFLSDSFDDLILPGDVQPTIVTNLSLTDYMDLLHRIDVSLCLTDTPYHSYLILELTANGSIVVTNRSRANALLASYSDNILCASPSPASLKHKIRDAIRLAHDDEMRSTNYFRQHIARDWTVAVESALRCITSLAEIDTFERC